MFMAEQACWERSSNRTLRCCWGVIQAFASCPGRNAARSEAEWCVADPGPRLLKSDLMSEFFVYIVASRYRGTMYVGVTNDLSRRMGEHRSGAVPGFTKR